METKICYKCKEEKDIEKFSNDKKTKDGKNIWCKECYKIYNKTYYKENEAKLKECYKTYREENKEKIKTYNKKYNKKNKEKNQKRAKEYFTSFVKYSHPMIKELSVYDQVDENNEGFAIIKCTYCGSDVMPTIRQVQIRIRSCNSLNQGECRIYCNNKCKSACPSYKKKEFPLGFKPASSREVDPLLRQLCFKRDQYICQHCGISIKEAQLHCHHINGVTQSPIEQNDLSNVITLCKKCHKELHKTKGCTYQDYKCS